MSLRRELVHYDAACLTILGSLITASAAIYGVVSDPNKHPYGLLCALDAIWLVGFIYIIDKRSSIIRIALYIKMRFESSVSMFDGEENYYYEWETWLDSSGKVLNGLKSGLPQKACTDILPIVDPINVEFTLLVLVCIINTIWLQHAQESLFFYISCFLLVFSFGLGLKQLLKYRCFLKAKKNFPISKEKEATEDKEEKDVKT